MANPTSRLRVCLPALAAAFSVLSQLEPAHACGALPCAQVSDVLPPDASVGVPLNTELRVLYFGSLESDDPACSLDLRQMRLLPSEGEPIDLTGSVLERPGGLQAWVVAEPPEPLAPDTTYALQLQLVGGVETCGCGAREWTTVTTFTTGDADDQEAPTFAGIERVSYGERETSSSDCGQSDLIPVLTSFQPPSNEAAGLRYNIYVDGELSKRYVALSAGTDGGSREIFVDCGSSAFMTNIRLTSDAALEVRAVDPAGNESAMNPAYIVEATCDAAADLESEPRPSTAVTLADGVATSDEREADAAPLAPTAAHASGCAISGAERGSALALLAALPLLLRRRRHG